MRLIRHPNNWDHSRAMWKCFLSSLSLCFHQGVVDKLFGTILERPTTSPRYAFPHISSHPWNRIHVAVRKQNHLGTQSDGEDIEHSPEGCGRRKARFWRYLLLGPRTIVDIHYTDPARRVVSRVYILSDSQRL